MLSIRLKVDKAQSCLEKKMARIGGPFIIVSSGRFVVA